MTTTTIPVIIETEEAKRRIAHLNMSGELETIADWLRVTLPDLYRIRVTQSSVNSPSMENQVVIWADRYCDDSNPVKDLIEWDFMGWAFHALPFKVCKHVMLRCTFRPFPPQSA